LGRQQVGIAHLNLPGSLKIRLSPTDIAGMKAREGKKIVKLKRVSILKHVWLKDREYVVIPTAIECAFGTLKNRYRHAFSLIPRP
jgi:hypothetical protein